MTDREKELLLNERVFGNATENAETTKPTYAGTFENQLSEIFQRIQNREPFSYDLNADPLYDIYKDKFIQGGKLAMKDTMGQAAALTGGYGNTYGQQVGQQAYDAYLQNLSDVIPQLYSMAYDRYQDEGDNLKDLYSLTGDLRDKEYGRYRDELGDYEYGQEVQRELEDLLYNRRVNEEQTAWSRKNTEEQQAWERQQKNYNNLMQLISTTGYQPTDEELAAAGMSRGEADAAWAQALREWAVKMDQIYGTGGSSGSSGGGGGGGGRSGGSSSSSAPDWWTSASDAQRKQWQSEWGTDPDGIWGPNTAAAYSAYNEWASTPTVVGYEGTTGKAITASPSQLYDESKKMDELAATYVNTKKKSTGGGQR